MMRIRNGWLSALAMGALTLASMPAGQASMKLFVEQVPLNAIETRPLSLPVDLVRVGENGAAFLAQTRISPDAPGGRIAVFDTSTMEVVRTMDVTHDIETMVFDAAAGQLHFAGNEGETFHVSRLDPASGEISAALFKGAMPHPSLAIDDTGQVYAGSDSSNQVRTIPASSFLPRENAIEAFKQSGEPPSGFVYYSGRGGVKDLAVSEESKVLFVSDTIETRVSAIELGGKQSIVDQIGYGETKSGFNVPLVMRAQSNWVPASGNQSSSLVLADYQQGRLIVADFNPSFMTMDVVTDTSFRLPLAPGTRAPEPDKAGLANSPLMIDTNADQTTILIGSADSMKLLLFGRNESVLEVARDFPLPSLPTALDVSDDGRMALVIHGDHKMISRLAEKDNTSSSPTEPSYTGKVNDLTRSEDVRVLQRKLTDLGFPIGAIDGMVGDKTSNALKRVFEQNKIDLNINDFKNMTPAQLQQAIKALEQAG